MEVCCKSLEKMIYKMPLKYLLMSKIFLFLNAFFSFHSQNLLQYDIVMYCIVRCLELPFSSYHALPCIEVERGRAWEKGERGRKGEIHVKSQQEIQA